MRKLFILLLMAGINCGGGSDAVTGTNNNNTGNNNGNTTPPPVSQPVTLKLLTSGLPASAAAGTKLTVKYEAANAVACTSTIHGLLSPNVATAQSAAASLDASSYSWNLGNILASNGYTFVLECTGSANSKAADSVRVNPVTAPLLTKIDSMVPSVLPATGGRVDFYTHDCNFLSGGKDANGAVIRGTRGGFDANVVADSYFIDCNHIHGGVTVINPPPGGLTFSLWLGNPGQPSFQAGTVKIGVSSGSKSALTAPSASKAPVVLFNGVKVDVGAQ